MNTLYQDHTIIFKEQSYISTNRFKDGERIIKLENCLVISKDGPSKRYLSVSKKDFDLCEAPDMTSEETRFRIEREGIEKKLIKAVNVAGNLPDKLQAKKALRDFRANLDMRTL